MLSESFGVCKCQSLVQSVLYLIMGHLSIDRSPHMHFPLMVHYQSSIYLLVERWYDNYQEEAYLTTMSARLACNMRSTRRPVLWPWWLLTMEWGEFEKLSWELIMTWPDIFDLIELGTRTHTHTCKSQDSKWSDGTKGQQKKATNLEVPAWLSGNVEFARGNDCKATPLTLGCELLQLPSLCFN